MYRNVYLFSKQPSQQKVRVGGVRNKRQAARGRHDSREWDTYLCKCLRISCGFIVLVQTRLILSSKGSHFVSCFVSKETARKWLKTMRVNWGRDCYNLAVWNEIPKWKKIRNATNMKSLCQKVSVKYDMIYMLCLQYIIVYIKYNNFVVYSELKRPWTSQTFTRHCKSGGEICELKTQNKCWILNIFKTQTPSKSILLILCVLNKKYLFFHGFIMHTKNNQSMVNLKKVMFYTYVIHL